MANEQAVYSVGNSLERYLNHVFRTSTPPGLPATTAIKLVSSGEMTDQEAHSDPLLSLYLYRITLNEHLRTLGNGDPLHPRVPLSVNLHYLLTAWSKSAQTEQVLLAWAMRELYMHPVLDISMLGGEAAWGAGDIVQIIPAELSNEDIMRTWDSLGVGYRLSVSYIARVVRIDPDRPAADTGPVVASRFAYGSREDEPHEF